LFCRNMCITSKRNLSECSVSLIVAITTVAELGDLTRFDSAKKLMAYLGHVPSEHSSGESTRRGASLKPAMVMFGGAR